MWNKPTLGNFTKTRFVLGVSSANPKGVGF